MSKWILRRGSKTRGFQYVDQSGKRVSRDQVERIEAMRIPPAWTDVHIAASDRPAIQAWGYDARGRKQYRYHARAVRRGQLRKYYRVRQMARDLPALRKRVDADFRQRSLTKKKVVAGILHFVAEGFFRIGSERYAKENSTFGITTLNRSHVKVDGDCVIFNYVGKRSIKQRNVVVNRQLARFVSELLKTPGRRLFRYKTDDNEWCNVDARDVNEYLQDVAGFPYTAKDFRTWGGTLRAATVLGEIGPPKNITEAKRNTVMAVRMVAAELGNTPAICRSSYIHPVILEKYVEDGSTITLRNNHKRKPAPNHTVEERALISFLDKHFPERRKKRRELSGKEGNTD